MKKIVAVIALYILGQMAGSANAIILMGTGSPTANTTAPTASESAGNLLNSGWQYQGQIGNFLGTPIAPNYFITAGHLPFPIGTTINYDSNVYTTDAMYDDPASDLRIYRVTTPFSSYAPLYTGSDEVGKQLVVFGRGTQRGAAVTVGPNQRGWQWGAEDNVQRWGTNTVSGTTTGTASQGVFLVADFSFSNNPNSTEAMLSEGDSGGGVFIQDGGIWKLAGINYGTDGFYSYSSNGSNPFHAALYNQTGLYKRVSTGPDVWVAGTSAAGKFYSSRISSNMDFIESVIVPEPLTGDLDGDGFVGQDDLNLILSNWGQDVPPGNPLADANGSGFIGQDDLNVVLGAWGQGTQPTVTPVPEPTTFVLMGLAGVGLLAIRRRVQTAR